MTAASNNNIRVITTDDSDLGYGQIFAALWRRKLWIAGAMIVTVAIAYAVTLRQKPTYLSSMQLLVEPFYQGKQDTVESEFTDTNVVIDNATQISLMQSSGLLRKAMATLRNEYPDMAPEDPGNVASLKGSLGINQISQSTGGKTEALTKIFQISYTSNDPIKAQRVLAALQKVYLDYNLEQQRQRLNRGLAFINKQLPQVRGKVKQAENALEKFRRNTQLINPDVQASAQISELNRVQQEQLSTVVQLQDLQGRYATLQQQLAMSPQQARLANQLSQSGRYQNLLAEIQKTELAIAQQRLRFNDNTPYVQQLLEQRQRQLGLLQTEMRRVLGSRSTGMGGDALLSAGQLGSLDQELVSQLVEVETNLRAVEARYQSWVNAEQELRGKLEQFPELLTEYSRLLPEIELNRETLKQLLKAQQDLGAEISRGGFDWQIVEEPEMGYRIGQDLRRNLLLGAVVGLFIGGLIVFICEAADDFVHSSDDLKKQVPVPLLGLVPEIPAGVFAGTRRAGVAAVPGNPALQWQPFRESLDLLYQNIQLFAADGALKSLVVTSTLVGEGKSTLAFGLAISAARLHQRVLLIDADLRRPSLHTLLNLPNDQGLSTLLSSSESIPSHVGTPEVGPSGNISILTAGPTPTDPAKLLSSQRMRDVLAAFGQTYDLVILDAPPVLGMVDAILVASCSDGVLMVGRIDRVTRKELTQAISTLKQLNVVGVVANGVLNSSHSNAVYQALP